ncbi:MAG: membrane protein insertion efficiency factor YidD [Legionellaceae bacterium]|nr:membrane protein insertion efficiency factor YidD [Legionellaceae bacterium]
MLNNARKIVCIPIHVYQYCIRPFIGNCCRFYPSCSEYTKQAIFKYGIFLGLWKGFKRILRCNPWHTGGEDLV